MLYGNLTIIVSETKVFAFLPSLDKDSNDEVDTEQLTAVVDAVDVTFMPHDNPEISRESRDLLIKDIVIEHVMASP